MRFEIDVGSIFLVEAILLTRPQHPYSDKMFCLFPNCQGFVKVKAEPEVWREGQKPTQSKVQSTFRFALLPFSFCVYHFDFWEGGDTEDVHRHPNDHRGTFDHSWGRELALLNGQMFPYYVWFIYYSFDVTCRQGGKIQLRSIMTAGSAERLHIHSNHWM